MHSTRAICLLVLAALLAGCQTARKPNDAPRPVVSLEPPTKRDLWMRIASAADADRLRRIGGAWSSALADARQAGFANAVKGEGELLQPGGSLDRPAPTPGSYNCRQIKIGRTKRAKPAFERFKPFFCYVEVEGELLTIVKQTGSERPAGRLWEDDDPKRLVFLGTLALGSEDAPKAYGDDPKRDMAGVLERVGPFRWRLVIPWPRGDSKLYVFELTPVADQPAP